MALQHWVSFSTRSWAIITTSLNTGDEIQEYPGKGELHIITGKNEDYFLFRKL